MYKGQSKKFGCCFREDSKIPKSQQLELAAELARLNKDSIIQVDTKRVYFTRPRIKYTFLRIFGIVDFAIDTSTDRENIITDGVCWSYSDKQLIEALYNAGIKNFFPYIVAEGVRYQIEDGNVYMVPVKVKEKKKVE